MFRFLHRLGLTRKPRPRSPQRRSTRLVLEALEARDVPSAVQVPDLANHTNLFFVGSDRQVYQQQYDTNGSLIRATTLTTPGAVQEVSAVELANGSPLVFVRGLDNQVWVQAFDGTGQSRGGYALMAPGQVHHIQAVVTRTGTPLLFVTGIDDQVYQLRFDGTGARISDYTLTKPG